MIEVIKFEYYNANPKKKISFGELLKGSICWCSGDSMFTFKEPKLLLKLPENSMCGPLGINAYDLINEKPGYIPDTVEIEQFTGTITLKGENVYRGMLGDKNVWIKIILSGSNKVLSGSDKVSVDNKKDNNIEYNTVIYRSFSYAKDGRNFINFIAMDYDRMKKIGWYENNIEVDFNFNQ